MEHPMSLPDTLPLRRPAPPPSQFLVLSVISAVFLALGLAWALVDPRLVAGVPVWMKPVKFALSFAVLFATLALVEQRLSAPVRDGRAMRVIAWIMGAAFLAEMAYMTHQAALAEGSHFNRSTPFHQIMYEVVMGGGAVALVAGVAAVGWLAGRDRGADMGAGLRAGVELGFVATFGLTMITAGYLSVNGGHFVGLHPPGGAVLPLFGWSGITGDLRPAHFAALHAMQVLPLVGLWLDRRDTPGARGKMRIAALAYTVLTLAIFAQALLGLPLIPLG
jgi:hypothetical protein